MTQKWLRAACIFGFLAVAIGAFGAHGLSSYFNDNPDLEDNYHTATLYQMFHTVGLLGVAWASTHWSSVWIQRAGYAFIAGILLFSGSLYILSITDMSWLGAITPFGGVSFLFGWASLAWGARQD
jgi:uncharacterized membrane protein YgdD (TMEM256/DUF423 family)